MAVSSRQATAPAMVASATFSLATVRWGAEIEVLEDVNTLMSSRRMGREFALAGCRDVTLSLVSCWLTPRSARLSSDERSAVPLVG